MESLLWNQVNRASVIWNVVSSNGRKKKYGGDTTKYFLQMQQMSALPTFCWPKQALWLALINFQERRYNSAMFLDQGEEIENSIFR